MSAIDNLYVQYSYYLDLKRPLVVLMHGWDGDTTLFGDATLTRMAQYGFFVVVPGMRGRNSADGSRDASGREIYDIYDAIQYILTNYAANVDPTKIAIVGYSGGGGNALAAACKFPDLFNIVVSHFGMSDYGRDGVDGWYANNDGTETAEIATAVGGIPATVPNNYYARDATVAIQNYSGGHLYLFHDSEDTSVPIIHSQRIGAAMLAAGLANYTENYTDALDNPRWTHGYPAAGSGVLQTEAIWYPVVWTQTAWTIPASGTVTVIGYIVTKRFTIWLRANGSTTYGLDAAATVVYNTATDTYTVTPLTGAIDVTVTQGVKTGSATNINVETAIVVS